MAAESDERLSSLSSRELACLRGVAEHKRSPQIAYELGLKPKTVDTYIANAMRKLGVGDRDSAARLLLNAPSPPSAKGRSTFPEIEGEPHSWSNGPAWRLPWPFPTRARPMNDMGLGGTIAAVLVAATLLMAVAALYLLAIRMLSERL